MKELNTKTLQKAALKAGISEKTARKYRKQTLSDKQPETFPRINPNPFEAHWHEVVEMLERAPEIQALTIITYLSEKYPELYKINQKRSMQRRVKVWRAENGSNKPVIFRQNLIPGRQSQSDWTHMNDLKITINGQKFDHLLFHFMLPYSGFETMMICQSESFESLTRGFEQAVLQLGGVAYEHRTDNLTAATQKMGSDRILLKDGWNFLSITEYSRHVITLAYLMKMVLLRKVIIF